MPTKNNRDDDQSTINKGKSPYRNQMFNHPLIAQTTQTMMSLSYARLKNCGTDAFAETSEPIEMRTLHKKLENIRWIRPVLTTDKILHKLLNVKKVSSWR